MAKVVIPTHRKIIVLAGAAGIDMVPFRNRALSHVRDLEPLIPHTTRLRKVGEIGSFYLSFISDETFLEKIHKGEFIEHSPFVKNGDLYGITHEDLRRVIIDNDRHALAVVDINRALQIKDQYPENTHIIFFGPPTIEILAKQLAFAKDLSDGDIEKILIDARADIATAAHALGSQLVDSMMVINNKDVTISLIDSIIKYYLGALKPA